MPNYRHDDAISGSIFHFTKSMDNLLGIMKNEFLPRYCLEEVNERGRLIRSEGGAVAVPMVCFCDSQLSQLREHLEIYGGYGIGMTKLWGMHKGLSPVMYVHEFGLAYTVLSNIAHQLEQFEAVEMERPDHVSPMRWQMEMASYLKPYVGEMFMNGEYVSRGFYDEREWRYVPFLMDFTEEQLDGCKPRLTREEFLDKNLLREQNQKIGQLRRISFVPGDITYLFVKDEDEILPLTREIEALKGEKFDYDDVRLLMTRIMSSRRLPIEF